MKFYGMVEAILKVYDFQQSGHLLALNKEDSIFDKLCLHRGRFLFGIQVKLEQHIRVANGRNLLAKLRYTH